MDCPEFSVVREVERDYGEGDDLDRDEADPERNDTELVVEQETEDDE